MKALSSSAPDRLFAALGVWSAGKAGERSASRLEDEALMTRVQAGDDAALGLLLDRYGRVVLGVGVRVLRDRGEAQELVQDVFLQVYRKAGLFDPAKGSFRAWLTQIAAHRAFDRREYLNLRRFYDDRNLEDYVDVIRGGCDLEYQTAVAQSEARLRQTFQDLSDKQRATLELFFFEGYTLREVAERLNESLANIRHYYYRALERLKSNVGERHD